MLEMKSTEPRKYYISKGVGFGIIVASRNATIRKIKLALRKNISDYYIGMLNRPNWLVSDIISDNISSEINIENKTLKTLIIKI